ncbi:MAG: phosphate signaling complex protein PhoU, partial [Pseudomonadota bacterium]
MIQHQSHIVHAFDQDLLDLRVKISELFEQAEKQLGDALTALSERDQELAHHIMKQDHTANQLESEIDNQIIEIIALRQPMAIDLRFLMTAIKVGVDLERIADKAKSIAKSVPYLPLANHHDALIGSIVDLGSSVSGMLSKSAKAYLDSDLDLARAVIEADYDVDELFHTIFHQCFALLTSGGIDSRIITRLVLVVKCLERIGDHSKNIAQHAFYAEQGHYPPRPQKYVDRVRARRDLQGESQGLHPARILIYLNPAEQVQQADTYSRLLQQAGHLVQVVDDHSAVINAISRGRFDLVILGWQMHGGAELVKDVRSKVSSAILVLDEGGEDINAIAALEA